MDYLVHGYGCLNLEVVCPRTSQKCVVPIRDVFNYPHFPVACSCCNLNVQKESFLELTGNHCFWTYTGFLIADQTSGLHSEWQEKGEISRGISSINNEDLKNWASITISTSPISDYIDCFLCKGTSEYFNYNFIKGKTLCIGCSSVIIEKLKHHETAPKPPKILPPIPSRDNSDDNIIILTESPKNSAGSYDLNNRKLKRTENTHNLNSDYSSNETTRSSDSATNEQGDNKDWLEKIRLLFTKKNVDPDVIENFVAMLAKRDSGIISFLSTNQNILTNIFDRLQVNEMDRITISAILKLLSEKSIKSTKRIEQNIYLKIVDAKFPDTSDEIKYSYCVVLANNNQILAKTSTIFQSEKTTVFLEDFEFTEGEKIETLTVLLKQTLKNSQKVMSKTTVDIRELNNKTVQTPTESWHQLHLTSDKDNLGFLTLGIRSRKENENIIFQLVGLEVPSLTKKGYYFVKCQYGQFNWKSNLTLKNKPNPRGFILWQASEKIVFQVIKNTVLKINVFKLQKPPTTNLMGNSLANPLLSIDTNTTTIPIGEIELTTTALCENKDPEKWINLKMNSSSSQNNTNGRNLTSPRGEPVLFHGVSSNNSRSNPNLISPQTNSGNSTPRSNITTSQTHLSNSRTNNLTNGNAKNNLSPREENGSNNRNLANINSGQRNFANEGRKNQKEQVYGEIRLLIENKIQVILPDKEYENLFLLLIENDLELTKRLVSVSDGQEKQVAESLVKSFNVKGSSICYINTIMEIEIQNTLREDVIFRGNTVATKSIDMYMRLIGSNYLAKCLKDIIFQICQDSTKPQQQTISVLHNHENSKKMKSCELDPTRIDEKDEKKKAKIRERNLQTLISYCEIILATVQKSFSQCPTEFRTIFTHIQSQIKTKFPNENSPSHFKAPGALIWLRFFCPAILTPKVYGMVDENPSTTSTRNLTLVGKTLQNLANLVEFGQKESFMIIVNPWIIQKKQEMKDFITKLCSFPDPRELINDSPNTHMTDPLVFGREMGRVHQHLKQNLNKLITKYGKEDELIKKLTLQLHQFDNII